MLYVFSRKLFCYVVRLQQQNIELEDAIDLRAGVSMYTDYPIQKLQKTAYFLKNKARRTTLTVALVACYKATVTQITVFF